MKERKKKLKSGNVILLNIYDLFHFLKEITLY